MDPSPEARVARARSIRSAGDAVDVYGRWAASYDDDLAELGFIGTTRIADLLAEHLDDRAATILDLGCGTGEAGVRLRAHGFRVVDGADLSPDMLAVARTKDAYRTLVEADLQQRLPFPDDTYDAAISAGTFTVGHVGPEAVPEVVRVLRPGATVAWVVGAWAGFEPATAGWEVVHRADEPIRRGGPPEAVMFVARTPPGPSRRERYS